MNCGQELYTLMGAAADSQLFFNCAASGVFLPASAFACVAAPDIQASIDSYKAADVGRASEADRKAAQKRVLDKALAEHPIDPFLLDRKRDWFDDNTSGGREAAIAFFAALHEKYPDEAAVTAEYADVLRMKDSAQAVKLLEASEKAHPTDSWTHGKLLAVYVDGKSRNPQRVSEEIETYLKLCPASKSAYVYRIIQFGGTHEQIVRHAGLLRTRLEAEGGNRMKTCGVHCGI